MQLIKFSVVNLILFAITWKSGRVIATLKFQTQNLKDVSFVEDLGYILTSCYGDHKHGVGLAGNLPGNLARTLSTKLSIPVALIDNTPGQMSSARFAKLRFRQHLQMFVVEASSVRDLVYIVRTNILPTIWWNHMASFFVLDRSPGCLNTVQFSHVSWRLNLLNAKLICYDLYKGHRMIFNYNPFTSQAPVPWEMLFRFRAQNNHPFAVFARYYEKSASTCVNLDFDKTHNLGDYPISVGKYGKRQEKIDISQISAARYWRTRYRVLTNIFRSLNVNPTTTYYMKLRDPITSDMREIGHIMLYVWAEVKITSPYTKTGCVLISQFRGHKTQLEKILYVIDFDSRLGMGIVYLITLIFLKFFVHQALVPALLNLVRITCGMGFENLSNGNAVRSFLTGLLFFVVTMQGIYQGNLAALLTSHVPRPNVEVLQDVIDLDYKLYGMDFVGPFVKDYPGLTGRYRQIPINEVEDCLGHVMNDSLAACLWVAQGTILDLVRENGLHTSSKHIINFYSGFEVRWDWPLEQKVNIILSRIVEADLILPWDVRCNPFDLSEFKYDEEVKNNADFKTIELAEVAFAFVILGIGLVCATIVFIIEVATSPK